MLSKSESVIVIESEDDDPIEVDLAHLYHPSAQYSEEQKLAAVAAYMTTGSSIKAGKVTGLTPDLIRNWKNKSRWWPETMAMMRKAKQDSLDAAITGAVHQGLDQIIDRMTNGDVKMDAKTGELVRVPMGGKELATTVGILFDKRQLIRGDATSRSVSVSTKDVLSEMQEQFQEMATRALGKSIDGTAERIE